MTVGSSTSEEGTGHDPGRPDSQRLSRNVERPRRRGLLLERHWSPDVRYVDPLADVAGYDGMVALVDSVHTRLPGLVFTQIGTVDGHHQQLRFRWGLASAGAEPVALGYDVLVIDDDGRISDVRGFLDGVPA